MVGKFATSSVKGGQQLHKKMMYPFFLSTASVHAKVN